MNERTNFILALMCLSLGYSLSDKIGENAFLFIIGVGLVVAIIWSIIAYRRGEPVFIWQKRNG